VPASLSSLRGSARVPDLPPSLPLLLASAIAEAGSDPFLGVRTSTTRDRSLTFAEFGVAVDNAAARLAGALRPGSRALVQGAPGPGFAAAVFAAARANVILVPLDPRMSLDTIERIAVLTEPSAILLGGGATLEPVMSRHLARLPVVDLDDLVDPPDAAAVAALAARRPSDPGSPVEILCTSGSTGNPKGVTISQTMLLASTRRCLATIPPERNRFVSILPLSHIMEQVAGLVYSVAARAETEYITTLRPDVIAAAIRGHRATALVVVPQVLELLFAAIRREAERTGSGAKFRRALRIAPYLPMSLRRRLFAKVHAALGGELRLVLSSASHLPPATQRNWEALGIDVVQGYGSTEAGLVTANFRGHAPAGRVGRVLAPMELRIEADGEVVVRGPSVFAGYWHDQVSSAAAFTPDGWYRTGDIGSLDAAGDLRLIGRTRSLIALPNGMNVHPEDVEAALVAEGLAEPIVYESEPGRIAVAFRPGAAFSVAPADEASALTNAVRGANRRLAAHQRIDGRAPFPDADFPRTHTRKVQRNAVAARMAGVPLSR
jgi:long-chain acyl-CoA synthetase